MTRATSHWLRPPGPVAPGLSIGLLGGSFNPPHEGHLHISEHTVRSYMRRIFSKLRVSTRPAMVAQLMKSGIAFVNLAEPDPATDRGRDAHKAKFRP